MIYKKRSTDSGFVSLHNARESLGVLIKRKCAAVMKII
jgi:hypothetical protein